MNHIIYWLWEQEHRVFLIYTRDVRLPITEIGKAHTCCAKNSLWGHADGKLFFTEGVFYTYEINPNAWEEMVYYLQLQFGKPIEATREIRVKVRKKPMFSSKNIQIMAFIALVLTIGLLAFR